MKNITILGSTGSIGVSTLDVISQHPDAYRVFALTAYAAVDRLFAQVVKFEPPFAVMVDANAATVLEIKIKAAGLSTQVLSGSDALNNVCADTRTDYVMAAIVGAAGLMPVLAAAYAGKRILLANKEALVMSGALLMSAVQQHGAVLLPIDSEHNAIFQCLPSQKRIPEHLATLGVEKIILTGSGGPFLTTPLTELSRVTPEQACAHPKWRMGKKISVDSATMMNKGLEVIEACYLFNAHLNEIQVVVHPQSVVHSMVQYVDGSVLAQLGNPDMRTPIAHALAWPERISSGVAPLDLIKTAQLEFMEPELTRFPCLRLAYEALQTGADAAIYLNAANEVAVQAFLQCRIRFIDIAKIVEETLSRAHFSPADSLEQIVAADQSARLLADEIIGSGYQLRSQA